MGMPRTLDGYAKVPFQVSVLVGSERDDEDDAHRIAYEFTRALRKLVEDWGLEMVFASTSVGELAEEREGE